MRLLVNITLSPLVNTNLQVDSVIDTCLYASLFGDEAESGE